MRAHIVIDDTLIDDALKASGLTTKRAAVEFGLRILVQLKRRGAIRDYRGKLDWQGDLDAMRTD